ncbi:transcriptional repressor CTCFL-like [Oppia nitens]|uniref:transcriptional repressor CTCFL-like n=1 Tax=Oppia nitens TaxID=1686743 RepID=UPI0023DB75F3|nr:transcriptional repressor CTCFL-like [Oppia nitens]
MTTAITSGTKRKADSLDELSALEGLTYEEYVQKDNERLRQEMRDLKDSLERQQRQKDRLEERLKNELELRLKEKRDNESTLHSQRLELEKMKKERQLFENQLKTKESELNKIRTALTADASKDDFHCDKCDFKTKSEVSLILHTINHKLSHPNQRRLILHPNMFSNRNPNNSYLYMCPICDGTALTRNEIYPHIYQNHTKEMAYKCNECDIYFTHIDYLRTHHKHEHERSKTNRLKTTITISGYEIPKDPLITTVYKPTANRGTQTVMFSANGTPIETPTAGTSSGTPSTPTIYAYSPQVMADEVLKCSFPHCSFTTNNKQKLEFHLSAHTNSKYKCPYCAYVGNILSDIYRHIKKSTKHDGKKVFECKSHPKCNYSIDCEKTFKEHLRTRHFRDDTSDKDIDAVVEDLFINKATNGSTSTT